MVAKLAALGPVLSIASGVVGVVGALSGIDQANAAAEIAEQQAERERQIAKRDAADFERRQSRLLASSRARRAGSGVTGAGSPLLVQEDLAAEIERGVQSILEGGAVTATRLEQQADITRRSGRTAGVIGAGTSLLTTAAKFV